MTLKFEIPEDRIITQGILVCEYMDEKGLGIQVSEVGSPTLWSRIGMLEAALDASQGMLRSRWEVRE